MKLPTYETAKCAFLEYLATLGWDVKTDHNGRPLKVPHASPPHAGYTLWLTPQAVHQSFASRGKLSLWVDLRKLCTPRADGGWTCDGSSVVAEAQRRYNGHLRLRARILDNAKTTGTLEIKEGE